MTQTLRRELRKAFEETLSRFSDKLSMEDRSVLAEVLAEDALAVAGISKRAQDLAGPNVELFRGDFHEYPDHLWTIAECLRDVWMFSLPDKPQKGKGKGPYSFYILAMDDIRNACGEFDTVEILKEVHKNWKAGFENGLAPYTVAQPSSLINVCRAMAIQKRQGIAAAIQTEKPEERQFRNLQI